MDSNIIETIRKNLGYDSLQKVDPNAQEVKASGKASPEQKLSQATIPTVLAGMIKLSDGTDGMQLFSDRKDWLTLIYSGRESEVAKRVAEYAGVTPAEAHDEMVNVSAEAVQVVKNKIKIPDAEKLRSYMNSQRHAVLSHLPAAMKIGDLLKEDTFDDRTNKMEGPVSGFLHRIENII